MSIIFKNNMLKDVGSSFEVLYTVPVTPMASNVIKCIISNNLVSGVQIDLVIERSGSDYYLLRSVPIQQGASLTEISDGKLILENGDILKVKCNQTAGVDVFISIAENLNND